VACGGGYDGGSGLRTGAAADRGGSADILGCRFCSEALVWEALVWEALAREALAREALAS
jgi:hypothetical protein